MRRWNGWGEETIDYHLPEPAARYLAALVGAGARIPDATLEETLAAMPESRLKPAPGVSADPLERLRHARGQSLPDWIALRSGRIGTFPDGVAYPASDEDVQALLNYARKSGARLIPYGGGTSVVGHINPLPGKEPILTIDLSHMNRMLSLDETTRLATFQAGVSGPEIERVLGEHGYTLGHYPQSFEYSTLGGWIATRSSGQQSHYYGRIEDLFAGGRVETPLGALDLPPHPASAAGPDLRQMILGSEGRLGIITRAVVRIRPAPRREAFHAYLLPDWASGVEATRALAQSGLPFSMARLSDAQETEMTLELAGLGGLVVGKLVGQGLGVIGYTQERCLLLVGFTAEPKGEALTRRARREAAALIRAHRGLPLGALIGESWRKSRFRAPYLRNTLWELGYALDTLETAVPWGNVHETAAGLKSALSSGLEAFGERVLAFAHLSHVYNSGASIYVTYLFRRSADPATRLRASPDETLERWQRLKRAASEVIAVYGGTISHQHGVGLDHAPYLPAEKGAVGMQMLTALRQTLDPDGLLNPGKLLMD